MDLFTLISGTDLNQWANKQEARYLLPMLLRRLIHATLPGVQRVAFPANEGTQLGGWDGIAFVKEGNAFVPDGLSVWEMGVNRDIKGKADDDYTKRTKATNDVDKENATFVFVTPRRWGNKDEWVRDRQKEGVWSDVRVYDADDLEDWLALAPAVHVWISTKLGKHPEGADDIESFWSDWAGATQPGLSPELLLNGRVSELAELHDWLRNAPST